MIEAELKARVLDPEALHQRLSELAACEPNIYRDVYYDRPGRELTVMSARRPRRLRSLTN